MNKHAYMIMAHHRPDILQLLINSLDDERNDIIVHIDKKSNMKPENLRLNMRKYFLLTRCLLIGQVTRKFSVNMN